MKDILNEDNVNNYNDSSDYRIRMRMFSTLVEIKPEALRKSMKYNKATMQGSTYSSCDDTIEQLG